MLALCTADKNSYQQKLKNKTNKSKKTNATTVTWTQTQLQTTLKCQLKKQDETKIKTESPRIVEHTAAAAATPSAVTTVSTSPVIMSNIMSQSMVPPSRRRRSIHSEFEETPATEIIIRHHQLPKRARHIYPAPCWTEVYRPRTVSAVIGNDKVKQQLNKWIIEKSCNPVFISGPTGIGKTSLAHAILLDHRYIIRDVRSLPGKFTDVLSQLIHRRDEDMKIGVIIDEMENLDTVDMRTLITIFKFLPSSAPPIICIYDNMFDRSMDSIKKDRLVLKMFYPFCLNKDAETLLHRLISVSKILLSAEQKRQIIDTAHGDLRQVTILTQLSVLKRQSSMQTHNKDIFVYSPFEATSKLLCGPILQPDAALEICRTDTDLIKMMVHENYMCSISSIEGLSQQSSNLSECDVLDSHSSHDGHQYSTSLISKGVILYRKKYGDIIGKKPIIRFPKMMSTYAVKKATVDVIHKLYVACHLRFRIPHSDLYFLTNRIRTDKAFAVKLLNERHISKHDIKLLCNAIGST